MTHFFRLHVFFNSYILTLKHKASMLGRSSLRLGDLVICIRRNLKRCARPQHERCIKAIKKHTICNPFNCRYSRRQACASVNNSLVKTGLKTSIVRIMVFWKI